MNEKDLSQLRALMPRGYRALIQSTTQLSLSYIDQVLAGKRHNQTVLDTALDILEQRQQAKKSTLTKFKRILSIR